jgi:hypothetical protein
MTYFLWSLYVRSTSPSRKDVNTAGSGPTYGYDGYIRVFFEKSKDDIRSASSEKPVSWQGVVLCMTIALKQRLWACNTDQVRHKLNKDEGETLL